MENTGTKKINGEKLKQAREKLRRWTIKEAARQFDVSEQAYIGWEKGTVKPRPKHLALLYHTFQLTPEELILPVEVQETALVSDVTSGSSESRVQTHSRWNLPTSLT